MDPALPDLAELEVDLAAFAAEHRVPAALVRAVVAAESAGNPRAVSSAGAIGLMQLMPGTAASLGVNPWQPRENLRGGITYLGSLLRAFDGNTRLALIAYNAGPQHAREVRAGRAVAYRETRQYLATIGARYPLPQGRR
jgi:soluble lytic murein transglycosylase-like protein